jgi:hypothetical protein
MGDNLDYLHLVIPSDSVGVRTAAGNESSPGSSEAGSSKDKYFLEIGCKVFEVNRIKVEDSAPQTPSKVLNTF